MRAARLAGAAGLLVCAAALAAVADAALIEPRRLTTTSVDLPDGPLARALGGERIVHLSDLHLRGYDAREDRLLAAIDTEKPAIVVMTGDYADTAEGVRALERLVGGIHARLGVFAVPGNNDYFRGRQDAIFAALDRAGATVLRNRAAVVTGRGGRFAIAGTDDPFFGRDDVAATLASIPPGIPAMLLAHSPAVVERRSEAMLFNAGDASGPWGAGWFWLDGSHLRAPIPSISFASSGRHTLRLQRREDGAGVGEIRLIPEAAPELAGFPAPDHCAPPRAAGEIHVDACAAATATRGSWSRVRDDAGCRVADGPDRGALAAFAGVAPDDFADVAFDAPAGVAYRVWIRIYSPGSTGRSDSAYVQFGDAIDATGRARFRAGEAVPLANRPPVELILAGHTHGGQVRLPWIGSLERSIGGGPFVMGRYDIGGTMLYISRGLGTSYLPIRFDCPPEIVVLSSPGRRGNGENPS
ncbi:MAG: metallophosphoesterase [Acidobacteria bacterium]|nr:metallophosphoesterase [Acidobacteriota bacterium]